MRKADLRSGRLAEAQTLAQQVYWRTSNPDIEKLAEAIMRLLTDENPAHY